VHQWSYDDIGNRTQQVVTPFGQSPIVTNYSYYQNGQGRNSQLLASDGTSSYTWDNNGNLLTKGATNYTWDYDDRLVGISSGTVSASYAYDYQGERIKKTIGGVETGYLYQAEDIIKETSGGTVTNFLHGIGIDDPAMLDRAGAKSYYFGDGLGSIREMTDATGTLQNSYSYGAWGELRTSSTTVANSYGYTGREFAEEGLYFYRARYLDPGLGRFISEDPMGFYASINFFAYSLNNPIEYLDAFGLDAITANPAVRDCLCKLWKDSGYGFFAEERAAWILNNDGVYSCIRWPRTAVRRRETWRGTKPDCAVALAHTHPNACDPRPSTSGPKNDCLTASEQKVPNYVVSRQGVWKCEPCGKISQEEKEGPNKWCEKK